MFFCKNVDKDEHELKCEKNPKLRVLLCKLDKTNSKWNEDVTPPVLKQTDMNMLKHVFPIVSNGRAYFLVLWKYLHS